jgi:protein tyrosine phosphatase (PTP) superfamily phosphohydrolase (DUF442 family)
MTVSPEARSARRRHGPIQARVTVFGLACAAVLAIAACGSTSETPASASALPAPVAAAPIASTQTVPAEPTLDADGHVAGIENFRKWSDKIAQGGQPAGEVAFRNLAAMGYRTIVSVDGARPDVAMATKYGLHYVHVPFGYDGVPKSAQTRIVKAVESADGPVFIHCHHGVARGPAGAIIARVAVDGISGEEAAKELKESGCSDHYAGLYRDVAAAVAPTAAELAAVPSVLPEYVSPGTLAEQMALLDRTWARVGAAKTASWAAPAGRADVVPSSEARVLWEHFREIGRLGDIENHGPEFLTNLQKAEDAGHALEDALDKGDKDAATKNFGVIKQTCDACHARWRD